MAAYKVLYVTGGPSDLDSVRALNITLPGNVMISSGDNDLNFYHARKGPARGTATCEDAESAELIYDLPQIASAEFTAISEANKVVTIKVTNFCATGVSANLGDGTANEGPVPAFDVAFIAKEIEITVAA